MDSFARLRSKFLASTSFNSKSRPSSEAQDIPGIHLPYLVCLLQTAGYHLGKVECINPKYMTQKGTTIEVSCGYSGQRCSLYSPEDQDMCNCFIKGEDSGNFFLEAVSQGHLEERWLVEKDSAQYCLPFISDDLKLLCKTVIMELVTMMKDSFKGMSGLKMGPPQIDSAIADFNSIAVAQSPQDPNDSTYILHTEMSSDIQEQSVSMSSVECSFEERTEHKSEVRRISTVCSAVSVKTESFSQRSSTLVKSPKPSPKPIKNSESINQKSSALLKSPKPSPLPIKNVQKVNSCCTRHSLIPKTTSKGKSTSNLKALSVNSAAPKDHQSPLSTSNSKSTPNLLTGAGGNKNADSQLKAGISNATSGNKRVIPQMKTPSRTKPAAVLAVAPRPPTAKITPLKNTPLKEPKVKGSIVVSSTAKSTLKSTSSFSSATSSTNTASRSKKTTTSKTEKVVQVTTAKASGCFSFKK